MENEKHTVQMLPVEGVQILGILNKELEKNSQSKTRKAQFIEMKIYSTDWEWASASGS